MKFPSIIFFVLLPLILITGCVTAIKTSNDVFLRSKVDIDPYEKTTWIISPEVYENYLGPGFYYYDVSLRALIKNNQVVFYQFYISATSDNWKFYSKAYDLTGRCFDVRQIDNSKVSANEVRAVIKEDFVITFDRDYLNGSLTKGLNIKATGSRDDHVFVLPSYYVEGFLKKVDEYTSGKQDIKK